MAMGYQETPQSDSSKARPQDAIMVVNVIRLKLPQCTPQDRYAPHPAPATLHFTENLVFWRAFAIRSVASIEEYQTRVHSQLSLGLNQGSSHG